jgi:GxxExxY protein
MNADKTADKILHADLTHAIIGAAMEVLNELGHGLHEKPYENALMVELELRDFPSISKQLPTCYTRGRG